MKTKQRLTIETTTTTTRRTTIELRESAEEDRRAAQERVDDALYAGGDLAEVVSELNSAGHRWRLAQLLAA